MQEEVKKEKYISCKWLESGVCFDNGVYGSNVKLCCYMSAPGGGNAMIFENYHGEKIDWDKFFEIKRKYREVQKSGGTVPQCEGCVFFEESEWEQSDYIDSIIFDHFTKCNCRCTYCYTEEDKKRYNSLKTYNIYYLSSIIGLTYIFCNFIFCYNVINRNSIFSSNFIYKECLN